jgi:hypothetical protein
MQKNGVSKRGLRFFNVHAQAQHFNLFKDVVSWLKKQERGEEAITNAIDFVLNTQRMMWTGLLNSLREWLSGSCGDK